MAAQEIGPKPAFSALGPRARPGNRRVLDLANSWICRPSGPVRSPVRPGHCGDAGRTDFVNSLSNAAIAAGLASSVVIIFVNPSNRTARIRSVVGGHGLALVLGSAFSLLLFFGPVVAFLDDLEMLRNLAYATVVGLSVLLMAITNSEHPPAATAIGMASREFDVAIFGSIIGAVLMLAVIKLALRPHLRDLT